MIIMVKEINHTALMSVHIFLDALVFSLLELVYSISLNSAQLNSIKIEFYFLQNIWKHYRTS